MIHGSKNTRVRHFSVLLVLQEKKKHPIFIVSDMEFYKTTTVSVDQVTKSLDSPKTP